MKNLPTREQLLNPVLEALVQLGGSGSNDEINEKVISNLQIPKIWCLKIWCLACDIRPIPRYGITREP